MGGSPESDKIHADFMMARLSGKSTRELENEREIEEMRERQEGEDNGNRVKLALEYVKKTRVLRRERLIAILEGRK